MAAQPLPEPTSEDEPPRPIQPVQPIQPANRSWRERLPSWWLRAVAGALVVALLGTAFSAYRLSSDLSTARATIVSQSDKLARTEASLQAATTRGDQLTAQVATMQAQLQGQKDCMSALQADAATTRQIEDLETKDYNLAAEGSVWAKANTARNAAVAAALDDYYQAYSAAFNGLYASANTWISRGNAQGDVAIRNVATMNAEIKKMDALTNQIEGMLATAGGGLGVCGSSGSSS